MRFSERVRTIFHGLPKRVKVAGRYVGEGEPVFVIAEVGINHNGDLEIAKRLIDAAADAGANAVKFQKRDVEQLYTKEELEKPRTGPLVLGPTNRLHRQKLEFSKEQYEEIRKHAAERGILFFASVWDRASADFMESIGTGAYKIASADLDNTPLLEYVAKKNMPVLLSTGMSSLSEIVQAVDTILAYNYKLVLLHCLSLYPSPHELIHMKFLDTLQKNFSPLPIGYSGHEIDSLPTLVAVARGAHIVERHLTLDRNMPGTDHAASLEPKDFKELVQNIRDVESILGLPQKPELEELKPLKAKLAKSIVSRVAIPKGVVITRDMLVAKSPGSGISPSRLPDLVGRKAEHDIAEDAILPKEALTWRY